MSSRDSILFHHILLHASLFLVSHSFCRFNVSIPLRRKRLLLVSGGPEKGIPSACRVHGIPICLGLAHVVLPSLYCVDVVRIAGAVRAGAYANLVDRYKSPQPSASCLLPLQLTWPAVG